MTTTTAQPYATGLTRSNIGRAFIEAGLQTQSLVHTAIPETTHEQPRRPQPGLSEPRRHGA